MMQENDEGKFMALLESRNVILRGHFLLTSGRHGDTYINKDAMYSDPIIFQQLLTLLNLNIKVISVDYDVLTGPAVAGAILAAPLSVDSYKIFVYPEKIDDKQVFRRGYDNVIKGKRIIIVEDIITTGGSVQKTIDAINLCGGKCVGVVAIWNRQGWEPEGILLVSIINKEVVSWKAEECPLCNMDIILIDLKKEYKKEES